MIIARIQQKVGRFKKESKVKRPSKSHFLIWVQKHTAFYYFVCKKKDLL